MQISVVVPAQAHLVALTAVLTLKQERADLPVAQHVAYLVKHVLTESVFLDIELSLQSPCRLPII